MAIQTISQLKAWFRKGLYPTAAQFADLIDSFRHKNDKIQVQEVSGLSELLNKKYDSSEGNLLEKEVSNLASTVELIDTKVGVHDEKLTDMKTRIKDMIKDIGIYPFMDIEDNTEILNKPLETLDVGNIYFIKTDGLFYKVIENEDEEKELMAMIDYPYTKEQGKSDSPATDVFFRCGGKLYTAELSKNGICILVDRYDLSEYTKKEDLDKIWDSVREIYVQKPEKNTFPLAAIVTNLEDAKIEDFANGDTIWMSALGRFYTRVTEGGDPKWVFTDDTAYQQQRIDRIEPNINSIFRFNNRLYVAYYIGHFEYGDIYGLKLISITEEEFKQFEIAEKEREEKEIERIDAEEERKIEAERLRNLLSKMPKKWREEQSWFFHTMVGGPTQLFMPLPLLKVKSGDKLNIKITTRTSVPTGNSIKVQLTTDDVGENIISETLDLITKNENGDSVEGALEITGDSEESTYIRFIWGQVFYTHNIDVDIVKEDSVNIELVADFIEILMSKYNETMYYSTS